MALPFDIDIAVEAGDWPDAATLRALVVRAVETAWSFVDAPRVGELSVAFVDDAVIEELNKNFRDKPSATNVLSFPAPERDLGPYPLMGDIVLAFETITREAAQAGKTFDDHLTHLIIHGLLHLQGYDHETDTDAARMEATEVRALALLHIDNPYHLHKDS